MKKTYITPSLEIVDFHAESIMMSGSIGVGNDKADPDEALSNKRQPMGGTWSSDNWKQVED